jgi:hypothetical protein
VGSLVDVAEGLVDITSILAALEATSLAERLRESLYLFPLIESAHVVGLTMVFGTIAIIDLRLLGIASARRPFTSVATDTLKWTWLAFALTAVTGFLMFMTNARVYFHNLYFDLKMGAIALSGVNMLVFELTTRRSVNRWDTSAAPRAGRTAAALSLALWISVIFRGRWVGFTTTHATPTVEPDVDIEQLLPK